MVTTISQNCYEQMDPKPFLYSLEDLQLSITGANGTELVYMGYIEAAISVPNISEETFDVPVLVVPNTEHNINVPVIIGTNVIRHLHSLPLENLSEEWKAALMATSLATNIGLVVSTNKSTVELPPYETMTISGFVRKSTQDSAAVTEPSEKASSRYWCMPACCPP
ncbi:hypothetical protein DPMN_009710 [Dreissena polymorpha]|uniref:Uncharacterized protein n=2 Tax=Dreissena polymorpha TaxID=45954 RepID=A0A9D4N1R0_DREPO|nr:hypothetical protein DPMN_009710 [Dreissena polymorpha]